MKEKGQKDDRRWRRRPEQRPDDILDGALIEFRARGFAAARIEDIAKHAGLSKGTVYLYFQSKEEMLKALILRNVKPIADKVSQLAHAQLKTASNDKSPSISGILRDILSLAALKVSDPKVGAIPLLVIGESGNFPELVQLYRDEVIEAVLGALSQLIERGIESGEFRPINPQLAVRSLMGVMLLQVIWNGVFLRSGEKPLPAQDIVSSHLDLFLNGALQSRET